MRINLEIILFYLAQLYLLFSRCFKYKHKPIKSVSLNEEISLFHNLAFFLNIQLTKIDKVFLETIAKNSFYQDKLFILNGFIIGLLNNKKQTVSETI